MKSRSHEKPLAIVTGGAGFIGSHLVELLLDEGFRVRCIDDFSKGSLNNLKSCISNSNLEIIEGDITEISQLAGVFKNATFTFHLAGLGDVVPSIQFPSKYFKVNVAGTFNVFECVRLDAPKSKIIYAASSSCYGIARVPTSEQNEIQNLHPYALSKYLGESTLFSLAKIYDINVNSVRIFNAYGPRAKNYRTYGAVMGVFLKQKLENRPLTIVGDGSQKRDFVHVVDVARAFLNVANLGISGNTYNLGSGKPISVMELASIIGGEVEFIPDRPGEPSITWANIDKIRNEVGWEPRISFEDGMRNLLMMIEDWRDTPLWEKSDISVATKQWFDTLGNVGEADE
jgi:UDP-glucose 4-epimerase